MVFFYKAVPNYKSANPDYPLDLLDSCKDKLDPKIFIPYPLWNKTKTPIHIQNDYPNDLSGVSTGGTQSNGNPRSPKHSAALNLINKVVACDEVVWVVIPRVKDGYCWVAKIRCNKNYEIWPSTSPWIRALDCCLQKKLKSSSSLDRYIFLADAAQGWRTTEWRQVAFPRFPRWFSKQFLAQSSFGEIHSLDSFLGVDSPAVVAEDCWNSPVETATLLPTINCVDIQKRLVQRLSPIALEFLCVELLNLDCSNNLLWLHVGGVGDGGNDAIGFNSNGNPTEFLSVKWQINPDTQVKGGAIIAYLVGNPPAAIPPQLIWCPNVIATKVLKHQLKISVSFRKLLGV